MASRLDPVALTEAVAAFMDANAKKSLGDAVSRSLEAVLGLEMVPDVLPWVGPDWGLCVTAPPNKTALPHLLFALRVQPGDKQPPVDQALIKALTSFAQLGVLAYNRTHTDRLQLKHQMQDQVEVKYLVGEKSWPPGLQPAFALKEGYLLLASSPEAIRRFASAAAGKETPSGPVPLLRVSLKEWALFVKERREEVTQALAEKNQVSVPTAEVWVANLLSVLDLFEQLELTQRTQPGQVAWTLRLQARK
jgi:hypothetical protein